VTYFGITIPPVALVVFYAAMVAGTLGYLIIAWRTKAPSARREPFRKPDLVRHAGLLLFVIGGLLVATMDGSPTTDSTRTPPHWLLALQGVLLVGGCLVAILGGRAYLRAGDAYPAGKHADQSIPPDEHRDY
jgi:protein-S-isoprenylcysteine O-methyltransferase Ste14